MDAGQTGGASSMNQTSAVPARAIPGASTPVQRGWADRTVWTERMLAALGNGVKGDKRVSRCWPHVFIATLGRFTIIGVLCQRANHDVETTDWRAVCGRTARTVRREGTARAVLYPYLPALPGGSRSLTVSGVRRRKLHVVSRQSTRKGVSRWTSTRT